MVSSRKQKNGTSGILNRTSAPKFGVLNPIANANKTLKLRQNTKNGDELINCSVFSGLRLMKMAKLR